MILLDQTKGSTWTKESILATMKYLPKGRVLVSKATNTVYMIENDGCYKIMVVRKLYPGEAERFTEE